MKLFKLITLYLGLMLMFMGLLSFFMSMSFYNMGSVVFLEWEILEISSSSMVMTFLFDWMSLMFMGLVMLISSMVMFYSTYYMGGDKFFTRFIYLVYLFVLSMILLILSPNLVSILLGWDGLGLVSYCLVIYYQNIKSANAGMITILSNRIGDVAILLSISWLVNFGSWNFFYFQFLYSKMELMFVMLMVIIAAMTKSAQMPFSAWLPAAMAAPTPVSALVHSSTLVTAGVYLLIRFNYMLGLNMFILFIGVFTMMMSGLGANFENDLKKIIALSTLSQLGLMMMTLGLGMVEFSFFHLMTHAMFKSLLFLCAGVFIHSMGDTQDIRHMGGLMIGCPITSFYFIVSSMALCGFPFLSGFYSKDIILEMFFMSSMNLFLFFAVVASTFFTLTYSVRLMYLIFFGGNGPKTFLMLGEEMGMIFPMSFLIFLSVFMGCFMSLEFFPLNLIFLNYILKMMVLIGVAVLFILMFMFMYNYMFMEVKFSNLIMNYLGSMWFLPNLSSVMFMNSLNLGLNKLKFMDHGWLELLGGQGMFNNLKNNSSLVDKNNIMDLKMYLFMFFIIMMSLIMLV